MEIKIREECIKILNNSKPRKTNASSNDTNGFFSYSLIFLLWLYFPVRKKNDKRIADGPDQENLGPILAYTKQERNIQSLAMDNS